MCNSMRNLNFQSDFSHSVLICGKIQICALTLDENSRKVSHYKEIFSSKFSKIACILLKKFPESNFCYKRVMLIFVNFPLFSILACSYFPDFPLVTGQNENLTKI